MNTKLINILAGLWLVLNLPIIPYIGTVFVQVDPVIHFTVSIIVLIIFFGIQLKFKSKLMSVSVISSLCVVVLSVLRFETVRNSLSTNNVDTVINNVVFAIIILAILGATIIYKIIRQNKTKY